MLNLKILLGQHRMNFLNNSNLFLEFLSLQLLIGLVAQMLLVFKLTTIFLYWCTMHTSECGPRPPGESYAYYKGTIKYLYTSFIFPILKCIYEKKKSILL